MEFISYFDSLLLFVGQNKLISGVFLSLVVYLYAHRRRFYLPAGPRGVPLLGYFPYLGRDAPHKKMADLADQYGPVFTLQLGTCDNVVLIGWEAIKEAFSKEASNGRPRDNSFTSLAPIETMGNESGAIWKEQKRFALKTFKELGFGTERMEPHILNEIDSLCNVIDKEGPNVVARYLLTPSVSNNVTALVFGQRYDYDSKERLFLDKLMDPKDRSPVLAILMVLIPNAPWLFKTIAYFGLLGAGKLQRASYDMIDFVNNEIKRHGETLDDNNIRDYIDGFLIERHERLQSDPKTSFTLPMLQGNIRGFFAAGSDTVKTTLEWLFLTLSVYQDVQDKIYLEIGDVIGKDKTPSWSDRLSMGYTQAVLHEIQRWKTVVPLNLPRWSTDDMTVKGVKIPKDTQILANFWSVHHDAKLWPEPELFKPERFLDGQGKFVKHEAFLAFSYGKRSCPGEPLAIMELFLYTVCILQKYKLSLPDGAVPDFSEMLGVTCQPKVAAEIAFHRRTNN